MTRTIRPFLLMAAGQALCLGLGLWLHVQFALSAARWSAQQQTSSQPAPALETIEAAPRPAAGTAAASAGVGGGADRTVAALAQAGGLAFLWTFGLQTIVAWLVLSRLTGEHSRTRRQNEEQTARATQELVRTRDAVIFGLAKLAESRDQDTGHHLERIALYSTRLATALRRHPKYAAAITPSFVRLIGISSALHDIGKVSVEDAILQKPGKLSADERFRMQLHAEVGGECIRQIERRLGTSNFLDMAREIALYHHERWDGSGYPAGLAAEEIPLAARIVAIADVYDALASRRVYKPAYPHEKCVEIIVGEAGRQFDPDLADVFRTIEPQFREIAARFGDEADGTVGSLRLAPSTSPRRRLTREQEQTLILALTECDAVELQAVAAS
ncbi:MAG TPA: HD domain-containing phosphohydrolase [Planctomycetaceae bacterium]|nr:HD domain-containing phosphohydrolase [Planctomycetaceae bacterium]